MKRSIFLVITAFLTLCPVKSQPRWEKDLLNYINTSLSKSDGGFGWEEQYDSHLTPTFAVVSILYDIGRLPENKHPLAEFIRTHHPQRGLNKEAGPSGTELRNLTYEQIQSILLLGGDVSEFKEIVTGWKSQAGILANYEAHGFAGLFQESMMPICHKLLGITMQNGPEYIKNLKDCRRPNGSFNNAPVFFGGDGNILNTYWGLYALESLSVPETLTAETIGWLQSCQMQNGGFTHQPHPQIGANDDVIYTWAGIKALKLLGAKPKDLQGVTKYLVSLRNLDGGFGPRPGLKSTPNASFYAIDALKDINSLSALKKRPRPKPVADSNPDFTGYKIFTVQYQAQGQGSPQEAVMLADSLNIDLWGVKYPVEGWIQEAQIIAKKRNVPVTFFISNEPHDNLVQVPGMGSFNHVLDYISPGPDEIEFAREATFEVLKNTTLKKLKEVNGGLMLQVSNNEPLARILIDESINNDYGYLALHTIHFDQNFMFWLPYLAEYQYRLPMVTLQDSHGSEAWVWVNELSKHRNLFIAKNPTYDEMIIALKNNWIVGVRHDSISQYRTRMIGGTEAARKFITDRESKWQFWDDKKQKRPEMAITFVTKDDKFEVGRPEEGVNIRIRCRWNGNRQTLRTRAGVLESIKVDERTVTAEEVVRGTHTVTDAYYLYKWGTPEKGKHKVEATIKDLKTGKLTTYTTNYTQN